jgi:hypothetical protein
MLSRNTQGSPSGRVPPFLVASTWEPLEKAVAANLEIGSRFTAGSLLDMSRVWWQARGSRLRSLEPPGAAWPQPLELQTQPESAQPSHYDLAPSQPRGLAGRTVEAGPLQTDSDCSA